MVVSVSGRKHSDDKIGVKFFDFLKHVSGIFIHDPNLKVGAYKGEKSGKISPE